MRSQEQRSETTNSGEIGAQKRLGSLGHRAVSGGIVTAIGQGTRFAVYMLSTVALSRLLSRDDFGLVAMVGIVIGFLRIFREAGLSTATVQKDGITHNQVSNLFWINVLLGVAASLTGVALSPLVAWFFKDSRLVGITIGLTSTFLLSGSSVQHLALLNREMRFRELALIDVVSITGGAVVGVGMAYLGFGYWALVGGQIVTSVIELLMAWTISGWRPGRPARGNETRQLVTFGASLTFAALLRRITSNADSVMIGRVWGPGPLGLYSRGMALLIRPIEQFIVPFDIVFIPILSRLQGQGEKYKSTFLQVFRMVALVSFPAAGLLFSLSRPLVIIALGYKWMEVVPIFGALSLSAIFFPLNCVTNWLPSTQQRNRDIVAIGVAISIVSIVSVLVGLPFGSIGVAWSYTLSGVLLRLPLQFHIAGATGPVSRKDLWRAFLTSVPLSLVSGSGAAVGVQMMAECSAIVQLVCGGILGVLAAVVCVWIVPAYRSSAVSLVERVAKMWRSRGEVGS